jgi:hypothetical protein
MESGIVPIKLLFFTSLNQTEVILLTEQRAQTAAPVVNERKQCTHKYHKPVNWHISGDRFPSKLLLRSPLEYMTNLGANSRACKKKWWSANTFDQKQMLTELSFM